MFICNIFAADATLDIRVIKVEFKEEVSDNSLTTGRGTFDSDTRDYKLDPRGARGGNEYWKSHLEFAKNYFDIASNGKVDIKYDFFPKNKKSYQLDKSIIEYNRSRKKGENTAQFDSARASDYAVFVNDVLKLAREDADSPLKDSGPFEKRVVLIAHAGHSRLVDGGAKGYRYADTPGDFMNVQIDSTWCDTIQCFWRGFEVEPESINKAADSLFSVIVSAESASQDGLNWGINGTIVSQIGRELGLPYSYDVVKGFSRLGYFDVMDFAGSNAGNGFFPSLPSAWMRMHKGWVSGSEVREMRPSLPGVKDTVEICAAAASAALCGSAARVVKIPINSNEYILLENRQRTYNADSKINVKLAGSAAPISIHVDSLVSYFLDDSKHKDVKGVIESIDAPDAALPASGIAAWRVNDWYINEFIPYGTLNAWGGDTFRDHQFGISLIEASGVLALGKEFRNASGESMFYFGSGSDLIPHKRFNSSKSYEIDSIGPSGYANTASTFGGYSGIKITALKPENAAEERTINPFTRDSLVNWRALKIKVVIERVGNYAAFIAMENVPEELKPLEEDFANSKIPDLTRINIPGTKDSMFLGNNRLHIIDSNSVPIPNFPAILSNGEPFGAFNSKPLIIDIDGDGSPEYLVPANNGLILAVNSKGKLLGKDFPEFPLAAGTFEYDKPDTLLLHVSADYKYLFAKHRGSISAFHLPRAKKYEPAAMQPGKLEDKIEEFFIFPNPIRAGKASARFRILAPASEATLDIFDITGMKVFSRKFLAVNHGSNQVEGLDFSKLGSDVYSARLSVKFASGKNVVKWMRIAVIK